MAYSNSETIGAGVVLYTVLRQYLDDRTVLPSELMRRLTEESERYNHEIQDYQEVVLPEHYLDSIEEVAHETVEILANCVSVADNQTCEMSIVDVFDTDFRISRYDVLRTLKRALQRLGGAW